MFEILNNIHFLRPWWFLALLPIIWIIWRAWQTNRKQGAWHEVIEPRFQVLLLGENSSSEPTLNEKLGYFGLASAWFLAVLALSGPWVKAVEVPAQKSQQGMVIVLDQSLSMLADDLSPNRLARVKYRLTDLLKQHPEYATGMVAYAGSAHTISPISEDNKTLLNLLPTLNPVLMPSFGAKPLLGLQQAESLLKGAKITQGHILWVTDDIEANELDLIKSWLQKTGYSMTVLTVGSEAGGVVQIPNYGLLKDSDDKLIMPKVPMSRFAKLERISDVKWHHLRPEVDEIEVLLPPQQLNSDMDKQASTEKEVNHPLDIGFYFLLMLLPFVAFIFRKGILLTLLSFTLFPIAMMTPQPSYAANDSEEKSKLSDFTDIFKSPDQQGYQAWQSEHYKTAEALFEDPQWRASALYKQGKYAEAAKLFELDKSAQGFYNLGNAYALNNQLQKARDAYEQALEIEPGHSQAEDNLLVIDKLLSQQLPKPNLPPNDAQAESQNETQSDTDSGQHNQQANNQTEQQQTEQNRQQQTPQGSSADNAQTDNGQKDDAQQTTTQTEQQSADNETDSADATQQQSDEQIAEQDVAESSQNGEATDNEQQQANRLADNTPEGQGLDNEAQAALSDDSEPQQKKTLTEQEQAQLNWLKQIPDQPGLFLKRKFEYQFQQNPRADNENEKQW